MFKALNFKKIGWKGQVNITNEVVNQLEWTTLETLERVENGEKSEWKSKQKDLELNQNVVLNNCHRQQAYYHL